MAAAAGGGIMTEGEMLRGKHTSFRSICRCVGGRIRQPYPNGDARLPATAVSRSLTSLPSTSADGRGGGAHSLPPMRTDTATPACACAAQECTEHALQSCTHSRVGTAEHLLRRRRQQQRVRSKAQFSILAHPLLQLATVRHLDVAATPHRARPRSDRDALRIDGVGCAGRVGVRRLPTRGGAKPLSPRCTDERPM
jgi:hypothetical protein